MTTSAATGPDPAVLEGNLSEISKSRRAPAELLATARHPETIQYVSGRDGEPTYQWREAGGVLRWLGRTSMPSVSSAALIEAFQPGSANVLLYSLGSGREARSLLDRLATHQAVFVVEPNASAAALALGLVDFSREIRQGRFVLFVGPTAWEDFRAFMQTHRGYLEAQRILSWPWFDSQMIAEVSSRLGEVNGARFERHGEAAEGDERGAGRSAGSSATAVAIVSNVVDPGVFRTAKLIEIAAAEMNWRSCRIALDQPVLVRPEAMGEAVQRFAPSLVVLMGCTPTELGFALPDCTVATLLMPGQRADPSLAGRLGAGQWLGVPDGATREACAELGIDKDRTMVVSPAAQPGLLRRSSQPTTRIAVVADGGDFSARGAGLHLGSHIRLYEAAAKLIEAQADRYTDESAADIVNRAMKQLGMRIESEEVISGVLDRVRTLLGPVIVRRAALHAMAEAGVEFDLFGGGWRDDSVLGPYVCGKRPEPDEMGDFAERYGCVVVIDTGERLNQAALDALAAGQVLFIRQAVHRDGNGPYSEYVETGRHIQTFRACGELVDGLRRYAREPSIFVSEALDAARIMQAAHTWTQRLGELAQTVGASR